MPPIINEYQKFVKYYILTITEGGKMRHQQNKLIVIIDSGVLVSLMKQ